MAKDREAVIAALKQAIQAEIEGYHFYLMAMKNTDDEQGRSMFQQLAMDEKEHESYLSKQLENILSLGKLDENLLLQGPPQIEKNNPIFSEKIKSRIKDAHYEMTALSVGIQLERNSQDFYQEQSEKSDIPDEQEMFRALAKWEGYHYETLMQQYNLLKEEYWADNRFAPF